MTKRSIVAAVLFFMIAGGVSAQNTSKDLRIMEVLGGQKSSEEKGQRWALLIGINDYEDGEINPLRFAVADVKAIYDILVDETKGKFKKENVKLLVSDATDKRLKPTKVNILYYLKEWLGQNVGPEDTVLIYFSGHGFTSGDRKYLLPMDTDTFYIPAYAIDNREFIEAIDSLKSNKVITILDSCHSGGVSRAGKGIGDVLPDDYYSEFEASEGRVTLASCSGNQQSFEWPEKGHGVFTYYLLQGLTGAANIERDQAITFSEVARYVEQQVNQWARERGVDQTPKRHMENVSGEIAVTYDLATALEMAVADIKQKLRSYLGTSDDKLSPIEISQAIKVLDNVVVKYRKGEPLTETEDSAVAIIASLARGQFSVRDYKEFSDVVHTAASGAEYELTEPLPQPAQDSKPQGFGDIRIMAIPWAEIYLDGVHMGQTPKILRQISAGNHTLILKNPNYKDVTRMIEVVPDQSVKVSVSMTPR